MTAEGLFLAIRSNDAAKVATLLEADASLANAVETEGRSALHIAAIGDVEVVKVLLSYKPNLELTAADGTTPLAAAAKAGKVEVIKALVASGASSENATGTLVHWATESGDVKCIGAVLYDLGIPVDVKSSRGTTALFAASANKKPEIVQFLLEHGANPNAATSADLNTPLHVAAEFGEVEAVRMLIGFGAATNAKNKEGDLPLDIAEKKGSKVVAKELSKPAKEAAARSDDAARFKAHGNKVFAEGENVKAAKFYSQAIQNDQRNHVYFSNRAACQFNLREFNKAYIDACRCIALSPKFVRGYFRKAAAQHAMKDLEGAKKTIAEGLAFEAGNKDLTTLLAQVNRN